MKHPKLNVNPGSVYKVHRVRHGTLQLDLADRARTGSATTIEIISLQSLLSWVSLSCSSIFCDGRSKKQVSIYILKDTYFIYIMN